MARRVKMPPPPKWFIKQRYTKPERQRVRKMLKRGQEPPPDQPRSRAKYDWW